MPTITPHKVRSKTFLDAVARITGHRNYPPKKIGRVVKWQKAITGAIEEVNEIYHKILKNYALLDSLGNFIPMEGKPGTWQLSEETIKDEERMKKYWADLEEFNKMEIDVDIFPLNFSEVSKVELSPAELDELDPLVVMNE